MKSSRKHLTPFFLLTSNLNLWSYVATKRRVKCSDSLCPQPTTTHIYTHKHDAARHQTSHPFPSRRSPPHPSSQPGPPSSLLSHRHEADTNVTLWKIITNKRTADCKQLAPLSGLSLVISLNPGRGQDHREGCGGLWMMRRAMCRRRK